MSITVNVRRIRQMELRAANESPNVGAVVTALRGFDALTLSELATATSLSRPTVAEAASLLMTDGLVERISPVRENRAGRPAARYRFRADGGVVIGVVVDDVDIELLVADLDGSELGHLRVPVAASGRSGRVSEIVSTIAKASRRFAPDAPIFAIGVGVPGFVDDSGFIRGAPAIPDLDGVHLGDELRDAFGSDVRIGNTAHLAAVAEYHLGAAGGMDTFLYLWAGPRITGAVYVGGRLHTGHSGASGSIGELDSLGWRTAPEHEPSPEILHAAESGDPSALAQVDSYADALAHGAAALALAIDPELVVVGYFDSHGASIFPTLLADAIKRHAHVINPPVVMSPLGPRAAILGGVTIAMEHVDREILGLN
jgi:predicted NBD/HSP70 family sugar kinase